MPCRRLLHILCQALRQKKKLQFLGLNRHVLLIRQDGSLLPPPVSERRARRLFFRKYFARGTKAASIPLSRYLWMSKIKLVVGPSRLTNLLRAGTDPVGNSATLVYSLPNQLEAPEHYTRYYLAVGYSGR